MIVCVTVRVLIYDGHNECDVCRTYGCESEIISAPRLADAESALYRQLLYFSPLRSAKTKAASLLLRCCSFVAQETAHS